MKENCLSLILLVCALNFGFGQIYTEDFTGQNGKGAIGPIPTFDLSDVTWSVDVSEANLSETTDWFQVVNEVFEGRDLDGNAYWHSPVIDISSYTNVSFSLDAIENGDHENIDIINTAYRINGGIWLQASANGNLVGNFNSAVVSQTGLNGSTLEVRVNMTNNADNENLRIDNVLVDGTLSVPCTHTITSFSPIEGPEGAEVTITGSGYTPTSTVNFNGVAASSIQYINANTLIATVPNGITTGSISVIESACTETGSDFTIIDFSGSCSSPFSDLIISEVYDSNSGSLGYIEIYNGTGATIDLSDYEVDRYATLGGAVTSTYTFPALNINDGQVLVGKVSNDPNAPSITPDFTFGNLSGFNDDDRLELVFSATNTIVDDWHDDTVPGGTGFSYLRNTNITGPNPTYNASEWVGNGTEDTSDLGNYSISIVGNPSVTSQPIATASCLDYTFSITAMPGNSGTLTYQWRFNDGNANNWQDVNGALLAPATVAGETTNTLSVSGIDLESYQFYCVVTEDASCSIASNAVKVINTTATWNGTNWVWNNGTALNTIPTIDDNVVINGNYDTSNGGFQISFEACECLVNSGNTLTIADNDYVRVQNNVTNNGTISIASSGALVQVSDSGTYTSSPTTGTNTLSKQTSFLQNWYEYTYWSSPLQNSQIETALFNSNSGRRYYFDASQFNDILVETNNTGTFTSGNDDIDDEGNDWVSQTTGIMTPGKGYATMHTNLAFIPSSYTYIFEGNPANGQGGFNTGDINAEIYIRPEVMPLSSVQNYNNWNFIGNPYPSAISATTFFEDTSAFLEGVIYLWSHVSNADFDAPGDENANFSQDDYAILNYVGGVATGSAAPNDPGNIPNNFIASGQGFFVIGKKSHATSGAGYYNEVVFNNRMRVTGNNNQFFRTATQPNTPDKLWVNLTSDTGIFSQILVGYLESATDGIDAMSFDAPRNMSTGTNAILSSIISNSDKKYAIQAKNSNSLSYDEVIQLGFYAKINEPTLYTISIAQLEGDFMNSNTIYLVDKFNENIHNLSSSNYSFTSENGEFNDRFEIVFNPETLSSNDNIVNANELSIRELSNSDVKIKITEPHTIEKVEILDILGRQIYNLKGNNSVETYNLSKLSKAAYIAKVTLSNGQVISKKAIKQK